MIKLNGSTHILKAKRNAPASTTDMTWWASWVEVNGATLVTGNSNGGSLNGVTAVPVVSGASSRQFKIDTIDLYNEDSSGDVVTFFLQVGASIYNLFSCLLAPGESVHYSGGRWYVSSITGIEKVDQVVGPGGDVNGPGAAINGGLALFDGTTGKILRDSQALISTDITLGGGTPSDFLLSTQKAVKAYADQLIAAASGMEYKGRIDCSANPDYPAATVGWTYVVSVTGKIGGASGRDVRAGDLILCNTTNAGGDQATVGADFDPINRELFQTVSGPASAVDSAIALFDTTTGMLLKDSAKTIVTVLGADDTTLPTSKAVRDVMVAGPASAVDSNLASFDTTTGKLIKDSGKSVVTTLGSTNGTVPTSAAVKAVTDLLAPKPIAQVLTGNHTIALTDSVFLCNTAGGTINLQLPDPATCTNQSFTAIKTSAANQVVFIRFGTEKIMAISSDMSFSSLAASFTLYSDGTDWWVV